MNLMEHWLEIVTAVYIVGMILYGHHRGFIRLALSVASLIVTLLVVHVTLPYATQWLKNETPIYQMIQSGMERAIGLDDELVAPAEEGSEEDVQVQSVLEKVLIENLKLPEQMKRELIEKNNGEIYKMLGVELFRDYVGGYLANVAIQIVAFVLLFLLVYVLLHILVVWLDLVARLPILSGMNQIAGAVLGGVEAILFVWIIALIVTALSGTGFGIMILDQIENSKWLSFLYDNNMIGFVVLGLLGAGL